MNRKIAIYEPDEIKAVFDYLKTEKNIIDITENSGISTIYSDSLTLLRLVDSIYLADGQIITINNINYSVSDIDLTAKTFNINATGLFHLSTDLIPVKILDATKWNLTRNFKFGSRIEINEILNSESKDPAKQLIRFPLVWLFINKPEKSESLENDHASKISMAFVHLSKPDYKASYRLDNNFKKIIKPLHSLFLNAITSPYFSRVFLWDYKTFPNDSYNRYFYGSSEKNKSVLDSPTDAIEIELNLTFNNQY